MAFSIGGLVNKFLDKFLPDVVGDVIGAAIDGAMGNVAGAVANGVDALEDLISALGGPKQAKEGEEMLEGVFSQRSASDLDALAEQALRESRERRGFYEA